MQKAKLAAGRKAESAMRVSVAMLEENTKAHAAGLEAVGTLGKQQLFDETLGIAIAQAKRFLETEITPDDPEYARKWAIKSSLIASILNTGVKIDENELRRQKNDGFDALMQRVRDVQNQRATDARLLSGPPC